MSQSYEKAIKAYKYNPENLKDYSYSSTKCRACHRDFSTSGNLKRHQNSSIVCVNWIDNNPYKGEKYDNYAVEVSREPVPRFSKELIPFIDALDISSEELINKLIPKSDTSCKYCAREFSTVSSLNKHQKTSVICDRWKQHDILENAIRLASELEYKSSFVNHQNLIDETGWYRESLITSTKRMRYKILDNLFLIDKLLEPSLEDIQCVVDISPNTKHTNPDIEYFTLPDASKTGNDSNVSRLIGMESGCEWAKSRLEEDKKVAVFCTTGFQRSIPFLVWYLWKYYHHPLEYYGWTFDPAKFGDVIDYLDRVIGIKTRFFGDGAVISRDELASWIAKLFRDSGRECDYGDF